MRTSECVFVHVIYVVRNHRAHRQLGTIVNWMVSVCVCVCLWNVWCHCQVATIASVTASQTQRKGDQSTEVLCNLQFSLMQASVIILIQIEMAPNEDYTYYICRQPSRVTRCAFFFKNEQADEAITWLTNQGLCCCSSRFANAQLHRFHSFGMRFMPKYSNWRCSRQMTTVKQ